MQIQTKAGKTIDISEDKFYTFKNGVIGFEKYHKYVLLPGDVDPFVLLQSTEDANLAFLLVDPFLVSNEYEVDVDNETLRVIGNPDPADVTVLTIVTVPRNGGPITANFLGPIVINKSNRECVQAILSDEKWTTKVDILAAVKERAAQNESYAVTNPTLEMAGGQ